MKRVLSIFIVIAAFFLNACDNTYDDTRIKEDLEEIKNRVESAEALVSQLESDMDALTNIINSEFITLVSTNADGDYVITYNDSNGDTHTVVIATTDDVVSQPIISIAQDTDGEWYWQQTTDNGESYEWILVDGEQLLVGGEMPEVTIDSEGYWCVNSEQLLDSNGDPILANDVTNTLFSSIDVDEESGEAVFILADGTEVRLRLYAALAISFDSSIYTAISDYSTEKVISYEVSGTLSSEAFVDIFTSYNLEVEIDKTTSKLIVKLVEGALEGNLLLMAYADSKTILKPLFFTYGTADIEDPTYNGSSNTIELEGDLTSFTVDVSANIDYSISLDESSTEWLIYNGTRSMTTTSHQFTADYFEDASGLKRTGVITFANTLYDVSATITVNQTPNIPEQSESGIGSATELVAFAAAVNAGASTERWENEEGEVILLNDIDMSDVESWTPIGSLDPSAYSTTTPYALINPFEGTFNGQGYAIKNFTYNATMSISTYGYGLFGAIDGATIKNLQLGDAETDITWIFDGTAPKNGACGTLVAYAEGSYIEACTNYYNIDFVGANSSGELFMFGGIVGAMNNSVLGGAAKSLGCTNYGFVRTGIIDNKENGGYAMHTAGICAMMFKGDDNTVQYVTNYGAVSCPSGRTGGLVGTIFMGSVKNSTNNGLIEDDNVGMFQGTAATNAYNYKRMGGLVGGTDSLFGTLCTIESCINNGDVYTHIGCRTGGFAGHSNIQIIGCTNKGAILGDVYADGHGPAWACGYAGASASDGSYYNVVSCTMGGYVGSYTEYKDNPTSAPAASASNAFAYLNDDRYNAEINN
ncbi:MAG: PL29 family lyase N-terminal domain-containing protein [Rikenellaceae bacterium]